MDNPEQRGVENTFEFKFARDLIRYVLEQRMQGLHWIPTGIFEIKNLAEELNSPFTPQIKAAVNKKLNLYEILYHSQYENAFPREIVTKRGYKKICLELAKSFLEETFTVKKFFTFCVTLSKYAGYSYLFGIKTAPEDACYLIIRMVRHLKAKSKISDSVWNAMQDFAEDPDLKDSSSEDLSDAASVSTETADEKE